MDDITDDAIERAARTRQVVMVRQKPGMAAEWDELDPEVQEQFVEAMREAVTAFLGEWRAPPGAGFV